MRFKTQESEEAEKILELLKQGANFSELAMNRLICPSASEGGGLGWFGKGAMVKEFEDAAFALENVGELFDIVETEFGWHVIMLSEKKEVNDS